MYQKLENVLNLLIKIFFVLTVGLFIWIIGSGSLANPGTTDIQTLVLSGSTLFFLIVGRVVLAITSKKKDSI